VVRRGEPVGLSGPRFHLGARTAPRTYVDPASLWSGPPHVFLVPADGSTTTPGTTTGTDEAGDLALVGRQPAPLVGQAGGHAALTGADLVGAPAGALR
jgi:hypothetical protein